jgi:hypothetical protein
MAPPRHYMEVSGKFHAPAALPPRKEHPGTYWIRGWVDHRAGLENKKKRKILVLSVIEPLPNSSHIVSIPTGLLQPSSPQNICTVSCVCAMQEFRSMLFHESP